MSVGCVAMCNLRSTWPDADVLCAYLYMCILGCYYFSMLPSVPPKWWHAAQELFFFIHGAMTQISCKNKSSMANCVCDRRCRIGGARTAATRRTGALVPVISAECIIVTTNGTMIRSGVLPHRPALTRIVRATYRTLPIYIAYALHMT